MLHVEAPTGANRKATAVSSPGSSGRRLARTSIGRVGCQRVVGVTTPIGSVSVAPETSIGTITWTSSAAAEEVPLLRAKKRRVGFSRPTQTAGVVADEPGGRLRERE